ncbi:MAG TPA: ABC transporter permease [Bryobacteraceae bacterium]|nr:ABC transporter permease [Bryobacteraceae bacterium]
MRQYDVFDSAVRQALLLIGLLSRVVHPNRRDEWRREWESEIWHAARALEKRGESPARLRWGLWRFTCGSLQDAAWHARRRLNRDEAIRTFGPRAQSAGFCLGFLGAVLALIILASGFLPVTRDVVQPLPYTDAGRIATVSQGSALLSTRSAIRADWVREWQRDTKLLEGVAVYTWSKQSVADSTGRSRQLLAARVSENFFPLLGVRVPACAECVLVSYEFWRSAYRGRPLIEDIQLGGKRYRVAGVLDKRFWFLSRDVAVWQVVPRRDWMAARSGVAVRLRPGVTPAAAERELSTILTQQDGRGWENLVDVSPLQDRVRAVFSSFGMGLGLAAVIVGVGVRLRLPMWSGSRACRARRRDCVRSLFFVAKTSLLLTAVLLSGIEFTRAASITALGGTDLLTEPLSTWLFLMASMAALTWSIHDQRRRCRVCLRRLGMAAHVGCPGSLLLDWAGTELVCIDGHGMLHVPEMAACWSEPERWTALDDSWLDLFAKRS